MSILTLKTTITSIAPLEKCQDRFAKFVLGRGSGFIVCSYLQTAVEASAKQADWRIKLYAVEKNPNAVVTLENWQFEEWGSQVTAVSSDMWEWVAPEKAGVIVTPISSSKLYNEVRACREKDRDPEEQFEMLYVVRLHDFHQLSAPQPCFTFSHPNRDPMIDNNRYCTLEFPVEVNTVLQWAIQDQQGSLNSLAKLIMRNQIILDYLLAEQGVLANTSCCVYINSSGKVKTEQEKNHAKAGWSASITPKVVT
ncbi:hypothetical protein E2I00_015494 [Balaenoptera physalus]|uniref:PRMT5 oligomerisation domain-containing protein n=1 Tax=Balaenoptera physalus TaxID=9770 RepID=A0A643CHY9_BALPH|nr:hypothetical protein E2I00_015494 [Balaenoptera physalus]